MGRLTDEELDELDEFLRPFETGDSGADLTRRALAELRERRAQDSAQLDAAVAVMPDDDGKVRRVFLTGREVESLGALTFFLNKHSHEPYAYDDEECEAGITALSKLTRGNR